MRVFSSPCGNVSFLAKGIEQRVSKLIRYANHSFPTYRHYFETQRVSVEVSQEELVEAVFDAHPFTRLEYQALQQESFERQAALSFVIDTTSGSTSKPVLKFTSPHDEEVELDAASRAFGSLGINEKDRVACIDVGASEIYLFYARALRELGVDQVCFVSVTPDYVRAVRTLARLDPTVIISVPSVLLHMLDSSAEAPLRMAFSLSKVIHIGEPMDDCLRARILTDWRCQSFSYYGTTEVGSVGIECSEHSGFHIPLDIFIPTLLPWPSGSKKVTRPDSTKYEGLIAWTSTRLEEPPVIMYAVNDLVCFDTSPCPCGLRWPRMQFVSRADHSFSLFGLTFTYGVFYETVQQVAGTPTNLELHLKLGTTQNGDLPIDQLTVIIPHSLSSLEQSLLDGILAIYPLSSLVSCGFLKINLEYVQGDYFHRRKAQRIQISHASAPG